MFNCFTHHFPRLFDHGIFFLKSYLLTYKEMLELLGRKGDRSLGYYLKRRLLYLKRKF
jgi:hypothetical protein